MPKNAGEEGDFLNVVLLGKTISEGEFSEPFFSRKRLDKYGDIRQTLRNMNLTQKTPKLRGCGKEWTEDWRCDFMHSVHLCTLAVLNHHVIELISRPLESTDGEERANHENSFQEGTQNRRLISGAN